MDLRSLASLRAGIRRRTPRLGRRALAASAGAGLLLLLLYVLIVLEAGDLPDFLGDVGPTTRGLVRTFGSAAPFVLLYVEESGIPMIIPGDFVVMWVGHHVPHNLFAWIGAWLGLTAAVVLGSSNLYFVSRKWGRNLVDRQLGRMLHLTPDKMARAESWFTRWGAWALIFGRHVFGLRVPLTVAAGIFKLPYPIFALSVAVSSSAWIAIFLFLGIAFGRRVAHIFHVYRQAAMPLGLVLLAVAVLFVAYRWNMTRERSI
ncbi:MAG: DedA family protein [Candidatus Dormibacteraeota bacterium]|nr:DedA family protein [Candidatus Dormibacteraeota bacterium]